MHTWDGVTAGGDPRPQDRDRPHAHPDLAVGGPEGPAGPLVAQPQAEAVLDSAGRVVLVAAPAGYGKSTAIRQWLRGLDPSARIQVVVDTRGRPVTEAGLWAALGRALQDALEEAGQERTRAGTSAFTEPGVIDQLRHSPCPILLVVDGYDSVDPTVDRALIRAVTTLGDVRLVLAARSGRSLWLDAELRAAVSVVTSSALGLTPTQILSLCRARGVAISRTRLAWIWEQTRGWPGLVTALVDRLGTGAPDEEWIAIEAARDYAHAKVLDSVTDNSTLDLLARLAVPERLTAVEAGLVRVPGGATLIDHYVSHGILGAARVAGEPVYEWPAVLRSALLQRAMDRESGKVRDLNRSLAHWYAESGWPSLGLAHAAANRDRQLGAALVDRHWLALLSDPSPRLRSLLDTIGSEPLRNRPRALLVNALVREDAHLLPPPFVDLPADVPHLQMLGRTPDAHETLDLGLAQLMAHRAAGRLEEANELAGQLAVVQGAAEQEGIELADLAPALHRQRGVVHLLRGDLEGAEATLRSVPESSSVPGRRSFVTTATAKLALIAVLSGRPDRARYWLKRDNEGFSSRESTTGLAAELLLAVERGERALADEALAQSQRRGSWRGPWWFALAYARVQHALLFGDPLTALGDLRASRSRRADRPLGALARTLLATAETDLLLALGRGAEAQGSISTAPQPHLLTEVTHARADLLAGLFQETSLRGAQGAYGDSYWHRASDDLGLLQAVAALRLDDRATAIEAVGRVLGRQRAHGVSMRSLAGVPRDALTDLAADVPALAPLLDRLGELDLREIYPRDMLVIRLTPRESLVLRVLAQGASVEEIASALFVSQNTVKTQLRSIYRKLGVSSRSAAVHRGWALGLIDQSPTGTTGAGRGTAPRTLG